MSGSSSAYPDRLMTYSNVAGPDNERLATSAQDASDAIQAFLRSNPDPSVMPPIHDVGAQVASYVEQKKTTDQWVFDVGLAFLTIAEKQAPVIPEGAGVPPLIPDYGSQLITASDGQVRQQLTNNALTQEANHDGQALRDLMQASSWPQNNGARLQELLNKISVYADDPVQMAAFFKTLGTNATLEVAHYIQQLQLPSGTLDMFDKALATASYSPTWDPTWAPNLVKDANLPDPTVPSTSSDSNRLQYLSQVLHSGIFSDSFLKQVGDTYLYSGAPLTFNMNDPVVPAIFQALSRNPDAAYLYLTGVAPYQGEFPNAPGLHTYTSSPSSPRLDGRQSRLSELELLLRSWYGQGTNQTTDPPAAWMTALAQATVAADGANGAPTDPSVTLLRDMATDDWQHVPDPFRIAVTQLMGDHINLFNADSPLSKQERFDLVALATNTGDGTPDAARIAQLNGAIVTYVTQQLPTYLRSGDVRDWESIVGWLSAIPAAGATIGGYSKQHDALAEQEQTSLLLGISFAIAGTLLPELVAGEGVAAKLGLTAAATRTLNTLLEVGKYQGGEIGKENLLKLFYHDQELPDWNEQQQAIAQVELLNASLLYAKDPSFLPNSPDPATAKTEIGLAVRYATEPKDGTEKFIAAMQSQCRVALSYDEAKNLLNAVDQPWVFYTENYQGAQGQAKQQYGGA